MQKLSFINSLGKSIDFTSGNLGITNWEGLASVDLNIQTQQVPLTDGSVFIDSLINDRELNFTLAMNDGQDLSKRYTMRRNLVSVLNPKLGEGELHYINDYIHVKIKCVPHVPIFENHNSNDSGTPKASLTFTACNPYWEDINTQEFYINNGETINVENTGDTEVNLHAIFLTGNVKNPSLKNLTTGKEIKLTGTFNNSVLIDTNFGSKGVSQDVYSLISDNLTADANFLQAISFKNRIFCVEWMDIPNADDYSPIAFSIDENNKVYATNLINNLTASTLKLKVVNDILYIFNKNCRTWCSSDGLNFETESIGSSNIDLCYFNNRYYSIFYNTTTNHYNLVYSNDYNLSNFNTIIDNFGSGYKYLETDGTYLYVFGPAGCKYSIDGENFVSMENFPAMEDYSERNNFYKVAKLNDKIYFIGDNGELWALYNNSFTEITTEGINESIIKNDIDNVLYLIKESHQTDVFNGISISEFKPSLWDGHISHFAYINQNKYYFDYNDVNAEMKIYNSTDGIQFFNSNMIFYKAHLFHRIASNGNIYIGEYMSNYAMSTDGFNWLVFLYDNWQGLTQFKDYIVAVKESDKLIFTKDGSTFSEINLPEVENGAWGNVFGNKDTVVAAGYTYGKIAVTYDLQNFELWQTPAGQINDGIIANDLFILWGVTTGNDECIVFGKNNSWSMVSSLFSEEAYIRNLIYFNEKYIMIYSTHNNVRAKYSSDLLNWHECEGFNFPEGVLYYAGMFIHNNILYTSIPEFNLIYYTSDGVSWKKWTTGLGSGTGFTNNEGKLIIPGNAGTLHLEKTGEINIINNLTEQSDMSFNFVEGNNAVMFSYDEGYATAKIEFNNKYIGV